jgi:hypothetical protein
MWQQWHQHYSAAELYYYHSLRARHRAIDFWKQPYCHGVMKADLRISIKDYHSKKNLKISLFRAPYPCRQFLVRMNGEPWPSGGGPVCLRRLVTAVRKALVHAGRAGDG